MSTTSPLASLSSLRSRLGDHEVTDAVLFDALEDISALARGEAGVAGAAWDPDVAAGTPGHVGAQVKVVVLDAARRRVLNPDAYVSEQSGDYSYRRAEGTEGADYFTPTELRILRGFRSESASLGGLQSIRMERPELVAPEHYYVPSAIDGTPSTLLPWSYE